MTFILLFFFSFILCFVLTKLLGFFSLRYNLLNNKGVPLIGGIAVAISIIAVLAVSSPQSLMIKSRIMLGILLSSLIMLGFGIIDDLREVSILTKFIMQVVACVILVIFGVKTQIIYIGNVLNFLITLLWVLGITNAFNHLDVMDGVATGPGIIISLGFFWSAFLTGNIAIMTLIASLAGSLAGFFMFNFPPAKVYLGNAGSHFLGFILAAIAITISYASCQQEVALLTPILMLGFPILDTLFLIIARIKRGQPIFKKSNDHTVLLLMHVYASKRKSMFVITLLSLFFVICAITTSQATNAAGAQVVILAVLFSVYLYVRMNRIRIDG
ncbi:MAG: undecaprenyl/decaprenyl-phosphate alpha-N-acetylglucosaminyl 1-phosphate transferase [Candidatus Omnitrophica bacterium]|nr:undecaprenyl/decaprenyl-phosphate alpha-N-acetylglucosaminyl 1-phosphate transferase [Candidatus Omnitrophota bacterium]